MGQTLSLEQAQERVKQIDKNSSGTIDFSEFYDWWISPDRNFLETTTSDLPMLKAKLQSKALMKTVKAVAQKVKEEKKSKILKLVKIFRRSQTS